MLNKHLEAGAGEGSEGLVPVKSGYGWAGSAALPDVGLAFDRLWRLTATALCFSAFGLGALFISVTLFPAIRLVSWNADSCRRRTQRAMRRVMQLFVWLMRTLGVIRCSISGAGKLREPGQLVIASHPSLIDVVILISLMPEVDCIVKRGLWRNPFLRWPVCWAGYIPNSEPENLMETCARNLRAGRSLIIFPEGTRTEPGQPLVFKRGAAQIALAADCAIRPVTIEVTPRMLSKSQPWHYVPAEAGHWRVEVGEAFKPGDVLPAGVAPTLAARQLTRVFLNKLHGFASGIGLV